MSAHNLLTEREYYLGFSVFTGIGPVRFKLLKNHFGNAKAIWNSSRAELSNIKLGNKLTFQYLEFRNKFSIGNFKKTLQKQKINYLIPTDELYPALLKEIADPPLVLYIKGNPERLLKMNFMIAIIGTRKMTDYGRLVASKITADLVFNNVTIVSGMALGIDSVAHRTALEYNGLTVAVLGSGIDVIYPFSNSGLYKDIIEKNGLVVSEYPPGQRATKTSFPARNRIISGMSRAVVVVEGALGSGSLITASYAADQGREVFAVPGPVTSRTSAAAAYLLKNGAALAQNAQDIIRELKQSNTS
ncbi:DNA protecting protein DprA [Candidatus Gottesmanbacteria bacterium RIFCSPHIGHO2_02_FULL_40_24]|nr:MAG: DNA protecting protein DprA [Candidatus Gottesmanbacteria bacterium RIFCSPHIGHO2_02_FULL_40_24]OGG23419.1 MAG: DNA protecting protein DprA [Candidatus Gottesmanbacteria bacterium RIFCSPHIGHO2_12_FULL_40_13]OGG33018.1 MAG: DNA protecting protein DprA [Candidatus Gottesmanbacteria bacterium RIFCSPLOWO2_02_FULL_40_10]